MLGAELAPCDTVTNAQRKQQKVGELCFGSQLRRAQPIMVGKAWCLEWIGAQWLDLQR